MQAGENTAAEGGGRTRDDLETKFGQPAGDLGGGVEPALRDGGQQHGIFRGPERPRLVVVEQHVVDEEAAAGGQRGDTHGQEPAAVGLVPVVEDV